MAAKNFLLSTILRVLTPEEISELTTTSVGDNRVVLTDIINQRLSGVEHDFGDSEKMAKILPFKKKGEEEVVVEAEPIKAGPVCSEYLDRFFKRQEMGDTAMDESGEMVETSSFIFNEKDRFAYSQAKLKQVEVLGLYKKNAAVDVEQVRALKDDMSKSAQSGVLIDKKQY